MKKKPGKAIVVLSSMKLSPSVMDDVFKIYTNHPTPIQLIGLTLISNDQVIEMLVKEAKSYEEYETHYHGVITDAMSKFIERIEGMLE